MSRWALWVDQQTTLLYQHHQMGPRLLQANTFITAKWSCQGFPQPFFQNQVGILDCETKAAPTALPRKGADL